MSESKIFLISMKFIMRARETQNIIWYYQKLGLGRPKILSRFQQLQKELERTPKRHQGGPVDQYIFVKTWNVHIKPHKMQI